jgi:hypothetical protein
LSIGEPVLTGSGINEVLSVDVAGARSSLVEVDLLTADGSLIFRSNLSVDSHGRVTAPLGREAVQQPPLARALRRASSMRVIDLDGGRCTTMLVSAK